MPHALSEPRGRVGARGLTYGLSIARQDHEAMGFQAKRKRALVLVLS
jgi:hypothetical protein